METILVGIIFGALGFLIGLFVSYRIMVGSIESYRKNQDK